MATGQYVLFINAGDVLHDPDTLSRIAALPEVDVYYGEALRVDENGRSLGYRLPRPPRRLHWRSLRFGMSVCHQSFIVRRSCAPSYNTNYRIAADIDWMIRCLKVCPNTLHTKEVISHFLVGGSRRSGDPKPGANDTAFYRPTTEWPTISCATCGCSSATPSGSSLASRRPAMGQPVVLLFDFRFACFFRFFILFMSVV